MNVQEAKAELLQVRKLDAALRSIEREIEQYRAEMYSIHATDYSRDRVQGGQSSDISDKVARLQSYIDERNAQWDAYMDMRTTIRCRIAKIDDLVLRTVLIEYYIIKNDWAVVRARMRYEKSQMNRLHNRALEAYAQKNTRWN